MGTHARIAVGAIEPAADVAAISWSLGELLLRNNKTVQSFSAASCFGPLDRVASLTGRRARHLDSWLMSPDVCRALFFRGCRGCDLALVAGRFEPQACASECSSLDTLCAWLDLPRIGVVDVHQLDFCRLPERPSGMEAVLLDNAVSAAAARRIQTTIESLWGVPVLAALGDHGDLDAELRRPQSAPAARQLASRLVERWVIEPSLRQLFSLAAQRRFPLPNDQNEPLPGGSGLRVAVAFDAAFHCYFADTIDALAMAGVTVCDFSPLRDERLPADCQIVYFGCGHPEEQAAALAANACLAASLREHVRSGGRLYAEGGGLAYLCREIVTADGQRLPMAGIFPLTAHTRADANPPRPVEVQLTADTWLAPAGAALRGYDSDRWRIEPARPLLLPARSSDGRHDWLYASQRAVGSRLHLNFAAQPDAFRTLVQADDDRPVVAAGRSLRRILRDV